MATGNTVDTVEDLMRILDEKPEWLVALRSRVLTQELLDLPEKLAQLAATFAEFAAATTAALDELRERQGRLEERQGRLEERQGRLEERQGRLEEGQSRLEERQGRLEEGQGRLEEGQLDLQTNLRRVDAGLAKLRGHFTRRIAVDDAGIIAEDMGFIWKRNVPRRELHAMTQSPDAAGFAAGDLRSFRMADLIMEVADTNGDTCYITVEASYTADTRDTDRVLRNARYMTHFTGAPAYAAIVSTHLDNRIADILNSGQVYWYEIPDRDAE